MKRAKEALFFSSLSSSLLCCVSMPPRPSKTAQRQQPRPTGSLLRAAASLPEGPVRAKAVANVRLWAAKEEEEQGRSIASVVVERRHLLRHSRRRLPDGLGRALCFPVRSLGGESSQGRA